MLRIKCMNELFHHFLSQACFYLVEFQNTIDLLLDGRFMFSNKRKLNNHCKHYQ